MNDNVITKVHDFQRKCRHNKFVFDRSLSFVECGLCGEKLNPIWVIEQFSHRESRLRNSVRDLEDTAEKLRNRVRCKCEHCGKMTRIKK